MTARVKICGITTEAGMDAAVAAGADWVGLNFFPASPRHVTPRRAAELAARPGLPTLVGLFVKPEDPEIAAVLAAVKLDVLQVYVDAPRAAEIRTRFGLPVWRAVGVSAATDLPRDPGGVDGFVIEAKAPPGATRPGGNAVTFDWSILAGWHAPAPWLLAGGLGPDNVAEAIRATGATAVDVASGVERQKGIKDPALVAAFARAARTAVGAT
ncbi:MAG: phosphoribosylanthranilate isomerase [Alphaproteobacteria bacterium]|nr:phosphoribosylanthranilate isomerase [Alphaproteobacteria bacterium]